MTAWRGCGLLLIVATCAAAAPACRRAPADDAGTAAGGGAGVRAPTGVAAPSSAGVGGAQATTGGSNTGLGAQPNTGAAGGPTAGSGAGPGSAPALPASGGARPVLAEVVNQAAALTVQVVEAQRVTADTVRIEIKLINTSSAPEPLDVSRVLTGRQAATLTAADLCLLTADGSRRVFVLRDAANAPMTGGGFEPLQPGERRAVWAVFPSPGAASDPVMSRVNVVLGGVVLRNVPIGPTPTEAGTSLRLPGTDLSPWGTVRWRSTSIPG